MTPTPTLTPPPGNQPPVIGINGASVVNEDDQVTFPSNWLAISDPDAGEEPIQVSLEAGAGNGTITILNHDGLIGGTWSGQSLTFQGPQAKIRDALKIVTFKPEDKFPGGSPVIININIRVDDMGHSGAGGAKTDENSYPVTINGVNDAPVMNVAATLELPMTSAGVLIQEILRYLPIDDEDLNAQRGIALTDIQPSDGNWEYRLDQGEWISVTETTQGNPSETKALLLAADENTRIRYTPGGGIENDPVEITFRAWDRTGEKNNGEASSTTPNGGATPFSSGVATVRFTFPAAQQLNLQQRITSKWMDVLVVPEFPATFILAALIHLFGGRMVDNKPADWFMPEP
jgi:hypothetical protein